MTFWCDRHASAEAWIPAWTFCNAFSMGHGPPVSDLRLHAIARGDKHGLLFADAGGGPIEHQPGICVRGETRSGLAGRWLTLGLKPAYRAAMARDTCPPAYTVTTGVRIAGSRSGQVSDLEQAAEKGLHRLKPVPPAAAKLLITGGTDFRLWSG
jgi:hypothetical protein